LYTRCVFCSPVFTPKWLEKGTKEIGDGVRRIFTIGAEKTMLQTAVL
jgi:hypothetical protein